MNRNLSLFRRMVLLESPTGPWFRRMQDISCLSSIPSMNRHASTFVRAVDTVGGLGKDTDIQSSLCNFHSPSGLPARKLMSTSFPPYRGAFPNYSVSDEDCMLSIRPLFPEYKRSARGQVAVERRGKLMLEFIPRVPVPGRNSMTLQPDRKLVIALSAEEVGLLLHELPNRSAEVVRDRLVPHMGNDMFPDITDDGQERIIGKVLRAIPGDGATIKFVLDYKVEGIVGKVARSVNLPSSLDVTVQAGEFVVIRAIFQDSLSHLVGWNATMQICSETALSHASDWNRGYRGSGGDDFAVGRRV